MISFQGCAGEVSGLNLNLSPHICRSSRGRWAQTVAGLVSGLTCSQLLGYAEGGDVSPKAI